MVFPLTNFPVFNNHFIWCIFRAILQFFSAVFIISFGQITRGLSAVHPDIDRDQFFPGGDGKFFLQVLHMVTDPAV